jgi:hypothetical protein
MPAYTTATARPRQELAAVIREGQNINKLNIHSKILPPLAVNKRTVHLVKAKIANMQLARIMDDYFLTAPGANVERMTATLNDDSFTVAIRKREIQIPDEVEMDYADYLSLEAVFAQQAGEAVELTTEYLTAAAIMNATTFGAGTPATANYTAANLATIDFVNDIYKATERGFDLGEIYNTVIMSRRVYNRVRQSTLLKNYVVSQLGKGHEVNESNLQLAFADLGIEKVLIGSSLYNALADGASLAVGAGMSRIWDDTYVWVGATGSTSATSVDGISTIQGVGVNAFWESYTPADGYGVDTYREEKTESNIVRGKTSKAPYIANANAGTLITTGWTA